MKKLIGSLVLKLMGWKISLEGDLKTLDRCILVEAPHTSNWDYFIGVMIYWKLGKNLKVIIKDTHTKAFYGGLIKSIGAIGIDRSKKNHLVEKVTQLFNSGEKFSLVITPEGTRSRVKKWKLGFYYMAKEAKVPIVLSAGDYKNKIGKLGHTITVEDLETRSLESILTEIQDYYKGVTAKHPEDFNPKIF